MFNDCLKCWNDYRDGLVAFFGITTVVCVWVLLNSLTAGVYDALDILLAYTQILSIVQVGTAGTALGDGMVTGTDGRTDAWTDRGMDGLMDGCIEAETRGTVHRLTSAPRGGLEG